MRFCQIRLIQLSVQGSQEKMNLGVAGVTCWQSQGSFSFECGVFEVARVVQSLCQFIVRVAGLWVDLDRLSLLLNSVLSSAE
jgi:hypothetical protein